jgi:uncharacterized membrane protein
VNGFSPLSRIFLILGLLLGTAYALIMGPFAIPDEAGHMYRTYLVSEGVCVASPAMGSPVDFNRVVWISLPSSTTGSDILKLVDPSKGRTLPVVSMFFIVNLYHCLPYIPAGAAFRVGRFFTESRLDLMYIGRFTNLFVYLLLVLLALRVLPAFELPVVVLALMPMSVHQAASLSADAVTMGFSFLLTAYILRLAFGDAGSPLTRRDYLTLLAGAMTAGLCKSNAGLLFLLLVIPGSRFQSPKRRWLAIAGYLFLAYGVAAVWQFINRGNAEIYATLKAAAGIHLDENAAVIFRRPGIFLAALGRTFLFSTKSYLEHFVGKLGWLLLQIPIWCVWTYLALLAVVSMASSIGQALSRRGRLLLLGIFFLNAISLLTAFWVTETPQDQIAAHDYLIPIMGRYLIPFALLPMAAVSGLAVRADLRRAVALAALAVVLVVNGFALRMVWDYYQAHTSTLPNRLRMALQLKFADTPDTAATRYNGLIVRRPGPSVEDSKVFLIRDGKKLWVSDGQWLAANGYKWPDDVTFIPAADLAAIPEGAPVR